MPQRYNHYTYPNMLPLCGSFLVRSRNPERSSKRQDLGGSGQAEHLGGRRAPGLGGQGGPWLGLRLQRNAVQKPTAKTEITRTRPRGDDDDDDDCRDAGFETSPSFSSTTTSSTTSEHTHTQKPTHTHPWTLDCCPHEQHWDHNHHNHHPPHPCSWRRTGRHHYPSTPFLMWLDQSFIPLPPLPVMLPLRLTDSNRALRPSGWSRAGLLFGFFDSVRCPYDLMIQLNPYAHPSSFFQTWKNLASSR